MQGEKAADGGQGRALVAGQIVGIDDPAAIGIDRDEPAGRPRHQGRGVLTPDAHHGARAGRLGVVQADRREGRREGADAGQQIGRGQQGARIARLPRLRRSGGGRLPDGGQPPVVDHGVLQAVKIVMEGENGRGQGHDKVKGQAEKPDDVMGVAPQALQIAPRTQGEKIFDQGRHQQNHPRHQGQGIEAGDHAHDPAGGIAIEGQSDHPVQNIDEFRQLRGGDRLDPRRAVLPRMGDEMLHPQGIVAVTLCPLGRALPLQPPRQVLGLSQMQRKLPGRFRRGPQGADNQRKRVVQGRGDGRRHRRGSPAGERFLEDRDRAGIKGDEQRHARQDAGPGVNGLVDAQDVGGHQAISLSITKGGPRPAGQEPGRWPRPATARRAGRRGRRSSR